MIFLFRFLLVLGLSLYGDEFFTISICTTSTYENAKSCEKNYLKNTNSEIKIIQDGDKFRTVCGFFATHDEASEFKKTLDSLALSQGAFIKKVEISDIIKTRSKIKDINETKTKNTNIKKLPHRNILKQVSQEQSMQTIFKQNTSTVENSAHESHYDYIDIVVDSNVNQMIVKAFQGGKEVYAKNYTVSTARKNAKKPQGVGKVTQIAVPPGHPQNYMGAAKINLTHSVDGKTIYRIHGTINDKTIGSYESSGCIRMKNKDAVEVASMLLNFSRHKNKDKINVILR